MNKQAAKMKAIMITKQKKIMVMRKKQKTKCFKMMIQKIKENLL